MMWNPRMVRLSAMILGFATSISAAGAEPVKLARAAFRTSSAPRRHDS
jgi:hypothetical protein